MFSDDTDHERDMERKIREAAIPRSLVEAMVRAAARELGLDWRTIPLQDREAAIDAARLAMAEGA